MFMHVYGYPLEHLENYYVMYNVKMSFQFLFHLLRTVCSSTDHNLENRDITIKFIVNSSLLEYRRVYSNIVVTGFTRS